MISEVDDKNSNSTVGFKQACCISVEIIIICAKAWIWVDYDQVIVTENKIKFSVVVNIRLLSW